MNERRQNFENNLEGEADEEIRDFRMFLDEYGEKTEVRTKKIETLSEMFMSKPEFKNRFENLPKLIDVLSAAKVSKKARDGKEIKHGARVLICGGFVRDLELEKDPKDVDLATDLSWEESEAALNEAYATEIENGDISIDNTGKNFSVLRVKFNKTGEEYEIATFRKDSESSDKRRPDSVELMQSPGLDAMRRDLKINALFYDPYKGLEIDFVGAFTDFENEQVSFVGEAEKRISEDHLRALRFIRFHFRTGFELDSEASKYIRAHAKEIVETLPPERIMQEFVATIKASKGRGGDVMKLYEEHGLLEQIMPEVSETKNCEQGPPYHMEGNVFVHTQMVCNNLPPDSSPTLVIAAMMHDIAKGETREEKLDKEGNTKVSFLKHAEHGTEPARARLKKLKSTTVQIKPEDVAWLVENHIRVFSMGTDMKRAAALAYVRHPLGKDLMNLAIADTRGSVPVSEEIKNKNEAEIVKLQERWAQLEQQDLENAEKLKEVYKYADGNEIIKAYEDKWGARPQGLIIKTIKEKMLENIDNRNVLDKEEALKIRKNLVGSNKPKEEKK